VVDGTSENLWFRSWRSRGPRTADTSGSGGVSGGSAGVSVRNLRGDALPRGV